MCAYLIPTRPPLLPIPSPIRCHIHRRRGLTEAASSEGRGAPPPLPCAAHSPGPAHGTHLAPCVLWVLAHSTLPGAGACVCAGVAGSLARCMLGSGVPRHSTNVCRRDLCGAAHPCRPRAPTRLAAAAAAWAAATTTNPHRQLRHPALCVHAPAGRRPASWPHHTHCARHTAQAGNACVRGRVRGGGLSHSRTHTCTPGVAWRTHTCVHPHTTRPNRPARPATRSPAPPSLQRPHILA